MVHQSSGLSDTNFRYEGQVAIVTGAGSGLGRAYARLLAARGARVVVNDIGMRQGPDGAPVSSAELTAREIREQGGEAVADTSSVATREGGQAIADLALSTYGRIDILVNNAGILRDKSFAKMDLDDFDKVIAVHLTGSVNCTKAAWPYMVEQGYGRILMTTSASGIYGNFGQSNYGAAKSGLVGLMNVLAIEGAKKGIKVNSLAPTAFTQMTDGLITEEAAAVLGPETVAPAAEFLVSPDAPTGVILGAGGGVFAVSEMCEAAPVSLGQDATAEGIEGRWAEISDLSDSHHLAAAFEQTRLYVETAAAGEDA